MRDAHTLHMRLGLVLLLAAAFFAVVPSDSLAIRFADTPCVESGTARVCPVGVVGSPYAIRLNGEGGCGPALPGPVSVQSPERVLATGPCTRQGRIAPRHTCCGGHLVLLGRVERRGPTLGRVVQASEVGARVHRDGRGSTSDCGIGLRGTGQRRRGRHIGVVGRLRDASTRPRAESNHGPDRWHACGHRHVRVQALGDRHSRRHGHRGPHDPGLSEARARDDTTGSRQSGPVVPCHCEGKRERAARDLHRSLRPSADWDTPQHEDRCAQRQATQVRHLSGSRSRRKTACEGRRNRPTSSRC